jgi:hypothetical protein
VAAFPHLLRSVAEIAAAPSTASFDEAQSMMRKKLPELWVQLINLAERSDDLIINEQVRDYDAERRRDERRGHNLLAADDNREKDDPIFTSVSKVIGRLNGAAFCRSHLPLAADTFAKAHDHLKEEFRRLRSLTTDSMTARQLSMTANDLMADVERLLAFEQPMNAVMSFFGPANLAQIAEWANVSLAKSGKYQARGTVLSFAVRSRAEAAHVRCPSGYVLPDFAGLHAFITKLRGGE